MRMIKRKVKQCVELILRLVGLVMKPLFKHIYKNCCVVKIEGGISSQLEQYVFGQCLSEVGGYKVSYDISSYIDGCSKDVLGLNARNFDLLKLDNLIKMDVTSKGKLFLYKYFFPYSMKKEKCAKIFSDSRLKTPVYFGGYGYSVYTEEVFEEIYLKKIAVNFNKDEFGENNLNLLRKVRSENSIAVHVRRGDTLLAKVGRPIPKKEYYLNAINMFDDFLPIYFFSDDIEWVKKQIIPYVPNNVRCTLVDWNGADKGWCDLILISNCKTVIKSPTGGLGREAFRLNDRIDKQLVLPVFVSGNNCHMKGDIREIMLDESLCDLSFVRDKNIRL